MSVYTGVNEMCTQTRHSLGPPRRVKEENEAMCVRLERKTQRSVAQLIEESHFYSFLVARNRDIKKFEFGFVIDSYGNMFGYA